MVSADDSAHQALSHHAHHRCKQFFYLGKSQKYTARKTLFRLAQVLQTIFINVSYHILVASLNLMALF